MSRTTYARRSDCPVASTLDLIGDRWTLLVLRDLLGGKSRFDQFMSSPEGIASNVLAERLARLEGERLILRQRDPEDGRRVEYRLTDRGKSLLPVILAVRDWGMQHIPGSSMRQFAAMSAPTARTASRPPGAAPAKGGAASTKKTPARTK